MNKVVSLKTIKEAVGRIEPHIIETPITYDSDLNLYLKWENHQCTGSFKVRGALNKLLPYECLKLENGVVTASAGNHGLGVALAAKNRGCSADVFVSEHATRAKIEALKSLGAKIHVVKGRYGEAETSAKHYANQKKAVWISAYNDPEVISGQGTLALECFKQLESFPPAAIVVPVGGGGLAAGIGLAVREIYNRSKKLIAVQSEASPFMHELFHGGSQENVQEMESLADGLAGEIESESLTVALVRQNYDDFILVSEKQVEHAINYAFKKYNEIIEGAAAVALAAVLNKKISQQPILAIITGGNIQPEVHKQICK